MINSKHPMRFPKAWQGLLTLMLAAGTVQAQDGGAAADAPPQSAAEAPANPADTSAPPAQVLSAPPAVSPVASVAEAPTAPAVAGKDRTSGIEEIIVTAQKRSENINNVPIAISAFTGNTLANLGVTDTRDLNRLVPGFNANESGRGTTLYTLRGVGFTDTTYTATNTVGTYIDEVNLRHFGDDPQRQPRHSARRSC